MTLSTALAATAVSAARLLDVERDVRRTPQVVGTALEEALGARPWGDRQASRGDLEAPLTRRQIALPAFTQRRRYLAAADFAYGDAGMRTRSSQGNASSRSRASR